MPFLQAVTGISGAAISIFLLSYGVAIAVGSFGGGRFADMNAVRTLIAGTVGVTLSLLALYLVGTVPALVAAALVALGIFGFGLAPSLQRRVVNLAGPGGQLAQSLPASAINLGIGGVAIANAPPPPQSSPASSSPQSRSEPPWPPVASSRPRSPRAPRRHHRHPSPSPRPSNGS